MLQLVGELFAAKLHHVESGQCTVGYLLLVEVDTLLLVVAVAAHEFVIRPLFSKFIPSMLKRVGLGIIVGLAGTATLMLMDVIGYKEITGSGVNSTEIFTQTNFNKTLCYLVNGETDEILDLSSSIVAIPYIMVALSEVLLFLAGLLESDNNISRVPGSDHSLDLLM